MRGIKGYNYRDYGGQVFHKGQGITVESPNGRGPGRGGKPLAGTIIGFADGDAIVVRGTNQEVYECLPLLSALEVARHMAGNSLKRGERR